MKRSTETRKRGGFSLVELTVVVLIMGILAAVAAPKLFNKIDEAKENGTRQSLAVVRSAIEQHLAQEGSYPANPETDLKDYMKGQFPKAEAISNGNRSVKVYTAGTALAADSTEAASWLYDSTTGEIRLNDATKVAW